MLIVKLGKVPLTIMLWCYMCIWYVNINDVTMHSVVESQGITKSMR